VVVELSDFLGETGQVGIARENVSVGTVRCWPQRVSGWGGNGEYQVVPEMIEPPVGRAGRVQAGQLKQWWLTVHVPPNTPGGALSDVVNGATGESAAERHGVASARPAIQLSRPADKHWGTWLDSFPPVGSLEGPERRGRKVSAEIDRLAQADIADYRAHGFDLVLLN